MIFDDDSELLLAMQEAIVGKEFSKEYIFEGFGEKFCLRVKIKPTTFEDGNELELAIVKLVTDVLILDDSVDVNCPALKPLQGPKPNPVDATSTAGPTGS